MKLLASFFLLIFSSLTYANNPIVLQDTPLREFVSWYTNKTNKTVLIESGNNITLNAYAPSVDDQALEEFFKTLLNAHGLDLVSQGDSYLVKIKEVDLSTLDLKEDNEPLIEPLITVVHVLNNVLADDLESFARIFTNQTEEKKDSNNQVFVIRSLNALALKTTEEQQATFRDLLPFIDTPRPLVYLEAIIYEDTTGKGLDIGLGYGRQVNVTEDHAGGFNLGALNELTLNGFSFGILSEEGLNFTLNAIENDSKINILSKPQVLILSGEEGLISVGQNVPFISSTTLNNGNTTQSIERKDVGVSLTVQPFVTQSDLIILNLALTADSINQSLKASDIITNTRNLNTKVRLKKGETLMLGGLVTTEEEEQVKKVPLLGSIPYLGALFRSVSTSTTTKELNIMLKATSIN